MFTDEKQPIETYVDSLFSPLVSKFSINKLAYNYLEITFFIPLEGDFSELYKKLVIKQHELESLFPGVLFTYTYKMRDI